MARSQGVDSEQAAQVLTVFGVVDLAARLLVAMLTDSRLIRPSQVRRNHKRTDQKYKAR